MHQAREPQPGHLQGGGHGVGPLCSQAAVGVQEAWRASPSICGAVNGAALAHGEPWGARERGAPFW